MQTKTEKRILKPYYGIILFALVIVFLIFGATPIQEKLGMAGVALTELILLAMAVIPAILLNVDMKAMFPVKKPKMRQVFGVLLLWAGTFLLGILATLVVGFFFPDGMAELSGAMNDIFTSVPMLIAYLIVAVMPAICEEALHRGFILTSMKVIRKEWVIVIVMGLIFGIFHLDPYRFAATAILGMAITYVMIRTQNILMAALFHLVNNSLSVIMSFVSASLPNAPQQAETSAVLSSTASIGSYLIIGAIVPFLILGGVLLLRTRVNNEDPAVIEKRKRSIIKALILSAILFVVMIVAGVGIIAGSIMTNPVLDHSETVSINSGTAPLVLPFEVAIPRSYILSYDLSTERGLVDMTVKDESGSVVYNLSAAQIYGSGPVALKTGSYTITFSYILSDLEGYYKEHDMEYNGNAVNELHLDGDLTAYSPVSISVSIK